MEKSTIILEPWMFYAGPHEEHVITSESKHIDIPHLRPFNLIVNELSIRISFSCHCWTEGFLKNSIGYVYPTIIIDRRERRALCHARYELSRNLEDIIHTLSKEKVILTDKKNYCYRTEITEGDLEYTVYFNIRQKGDKSLLMHVESAYLRPKDKRDRGMPIRFTTVIEKTSKGEQIKYKP